MNEASVWAIREARTEPEIWLFSEERKILKSLVLDDRRKFLQTLEKRLRHEPGTTLPDYVLLNLAQVEDFFHENMVGLEEEDEQGERLTTLLGRKLPVKAPNGLQPDEKQWANLRRLRAASFRFHSRLLMITGKEGLRKFRFKHDYLMPEFRQQTIRSSDFLVTGIITFRRVLRGLVPETLKEVLSFVSLAYVMAKELQSNGIMHNPIEFFRGLPSWKQAINGYAEQDIFQELAICLWPECYSVFNQEANDVTTTTAPSFAPLQQPETLLENFPILETLESFATSHSNGIDTSYNSSNPFPQSSEGLPITEYGAMAAQNGVSGPAGVEIPISVHGLPYDPGGVEDQLKSFQKPLRDLLEQSRATDQFHFSDFLNIPVDQSPVLPSMFPPELDLDVELESKNSRLLDFERDTNLIAQGFLMFTLSQLWQSIIFQIALQYLSCKYRVQRCVSTLTDQYLSP